MPQTLEQRRCQHAWQQIEPIQQQEFARSGALRAALEGFPSQLLINGLLTILLKLGNDAKGEAEESLIAAFLLKSLKDWLTGPESPVAIPAGSWPAALAGADAYVYGQAARESLRYATWLKRWAQAALPKRSTTREETTNA